MVRDGEIDRLLVYHTLEMADKTGQAPLDTSGDLWLDNHVLTFLKANQSFVDQEILG